MYVFEIYLKYNVFTMYVGIYVKYLFIFIIISVFI